MKLISKILTGIFIILMLLSLGASIFFGIDLAAGKEGFVEMTEKEATYEKIYFVVSLLCFILGYVLAKFVNSKFN